MADTGNPYAAIGVRSFINCCGTRTIHSGTLMRPEVTRAMMAAARYFVNMDELMEGVGRQLADLTGAEWGIVTSGAAASLCHATAACVTGGDPEKMLRLPDTAGMKRVVVMMCDGRFTYDHAIRAVGVEIVETEPHAVADVLNDDVAMVALLGTRESQRLDLLEQTVNPAHGQGIPVLVDAASEHLDRPDPYLARGVDMVAYSGGKYLRGPQCTGLLLGRKHWIQTAWRCAAPHHTLGRAMKIGKEEVMGVLAAVEYWAQRRMHQAEQTQWDNDLQCIAQIVEHVATVQTTILRSDNPRSPVPRLAIQWDPNRIGLTGLGLRQQLLVDDPRIMLDDRGATDGSVFILPFSLQPGDAPIVGEAIRSALAAADPPRATAVARPPDVRGVWDIVITFTDDAAHHRIVLEQDGTVLMGTHRTLFHLHSVSGSILDNRLSLQSLHPYEGTHLAYRFEGVVEDDRVEGRVYLGTSGQSAPGPLNQQEYGTSSWQGVRAPSG
jgi:L-seryl-tRNA(Ser) seleniumtransferase